MKKEVYIIALGGNALIQRDKKTTIKSQFQTLRRSLIHLIPLIKKHRIVIVFGNGPQIGNILIRVEEAYGKAYSLPLEVCVAESEGEIGYMIEQVLRNIMQEHKLHNTPVVNILTQVVVNKKDPAFKKPTKPIGPFYTLKQASDIVNKGYKVINDAGRGYRRVVPSPKPEYIVEAKTIKKLIKDTIVIAAGGGGIPVYKSGNKLRGIEAVIDKDLASSCLAKSIKANNLIILTGVDRVYLNFNKKNKKGIKKMNIKEAKKYQEEGHFLPGSMGPKIEAAIDFLENGGKKVIITSPNKLHKALKRKAGTIISKV